MNDDKQVEYYISIVHELRKLPHETEWVEFKRNNDKPEEIGQHLSDLANSAGLLGKVNGYLLWGIDNNPMISLVRPSELAGSR